MKLPDKKHYKSYGGHTRLLSILFMASVFCSCTLGREKDTDTAREYGLVTISVAAPAKTRALTEAQQSDISTMEVLVFDRTPAANFVMMASTDQVDDVSHPTDVIKEFSVRLPAGNCDIVLLANSGKWIDESFAVSQDGIIPAGSALTLDDIKKALKASVTAGTGWNAVPGSAGYVPLPMTGEKNDVTILAHDGNTIGIVDMCRAVARVDVKLTDDVDESVFKLHSVRVYNYHTTGYLFPGCYNAAGVTLTPAPHDKPYRRTITDPQTNTTKIVGEIFLFEFDNQLDQTLEDIRERRICLVVGGYYKDDLSLSYYRIDFRLPEDPPVPGAWKYFDVERNAHYQFDIDEVRESGWPDEEVAFRGVPRDMIYKVTNWKEIEFPDTPL